MKNTLRFLPALNILIQLLVTVPVHARDVVVETYKQLGQAKIFWGKEGVIFSKECHNDELTGYNREEMINSCTGSRVKSMPVLQFKRYFQSWVLGKQGTKLSKNNERNKPFTEQELNYYKSAFDIGFSGKYNKVAIENTIAYLVDQLMSADLRMTPEHSLIPFSPYELAEIKIGLIAEIEKLGKKPDGAVDLVKVINVYKEVYNRKKVKTTAPDLSQLSELNISQKNIGQFYVLLKYLMDTETIANVDTFIDQLIETLHNEEIAQKESSNVSYKDGEVILDEETFVGRTLDFLNLGSVLLPCGLSGTLEQRLADCRLMNGGKQLNDEFEIFSNEFSSSRVGDLNSVLLSNTLQFHKESKTVYHAKLSGEPETLEKAINRCHQLNQNNYLKNMYDLPKNKGWRLATEQEINRLPRTALVENLNSILWPDYKRYQLTDKPFFIGEVLFELDRHTNEFKKSKSSYQKNGFYFCTLAL
jgi:hypothetical protein